jgi:hypothetical protein
MYYYITHYFRDEKPIVVTLTRLLPMKNLYTFIILIVFRTSLFAQADRLMETSDIPLFWKVYDKVTPMKDSAAAIIFR